MAEETLTLLSSEAVWGQSGMSFDIGGSLIKLAFCRSDPDAGTATLTFRSFPVSELDAAIQYCLDSHADLVGDGGAMYVCGVGIGPSMAKVCQKLILERPVIVSEMDCYVEGFSFLYEHLSQGEMCFPESEKAKAYVERQFREWGAMAAGSSGAKPERQEGDAEWVVHKYRQIKPEEVSTTKYPVLLGLLGSGYGAILIHENNKYSVPDPATRSGKTFLGLGSLLTGEKTFDGLISLAERGDVDNTLVSGQHLKTDDTDSVYSVMPDHMPLYCFGHAAGKELGDFKKEDLAAGLLSTLAQDLAQITHLNALLQNVSKVYFGGSFGGLSQTVRDEVSTHFLTRAVSRMDVKVEHHFMKYGGYLGVLGTLRRTLRGQKRRKDSAGT